MSARPSADGATGETSELYRALGHPLRARAFELLCQAPASPSELSRTMDVPVATLSYHVRVLAEGDWIELVETRPRRGAIEHFYQASGKARRHVFVLDEVAWRQILDDGDALFARARELEAEAMRRAGAASSADARFAVTMVALMRRASPDASGDE